MREEDKVPMGIWLKPTPQAPQTLNPKSPNPKPLNPKPLNHTMPEALKLKTVSPAQSLSRKAQQPWGGKQAKFTAGSP